MIQETKAILQSNKLCNIALIITIISAMQAVLSKIPPIKIDNLGTNLEDSVKRTTEISNNFLKLFDDFPFFRTF